MLFGSYTPVDLIFNHADLRQGNKCCKFDLQWTMNVYCNHMTDEDKMKQGLIRDFNAAVQVLPCHREGAQKKNDRCKN